MVDPPSSFIHKKVDRPHSSGNDSISSKFWNELDACLETFYEKRGSKKVAALATIVEALESRMLHNFLQNKYTTLLHHCINSIKRGSTKEAYLAARTIGLLAVLVGMGGNAHDFVDETLTKLCPAVQFVTESAKCSSIIDCLAVTTFICASEWDETEKVMKVFWDIIQPDAGPVKETPNAVVAAAVSAWSFLLTTVIEPRIGYNSWQDRSLPYLSNLLDKDDCSVRMAAGEAIALIFERRVRNFSSKESDMDNVNDESPNARRLTLETLEETIVGQVRELVNQEGDECPTKEEMNSQSSLFQKILKFVEGGDFPKVTVKTSSKGSVLTVSTWAKSIQLKFLKKFLGKGFLTHMQQNELLHDIFDFAPKKQGNLKMDLGTNSDFVNNVDFLPLLENNSNKFSSIATLKAARSNVSAKDKRADLSSNSCTNKRRTQLRNKYRSWSQGRNEGHFSVACDD